eukprot:CAMPEP_0178437942 /NCGR_PEP_ID=MMETSP0689_2-20121128/35288_1 /TAXON_ID=160604 /ORGANISM="Amphidinium massartii, Strain CS-259" /LENGTH=289 /DNA_ID=CAMNT_0020060231 /DNA_START=134 /DNA_END=1000 /DNA_ORIENTATION=+
MGCPTLPGVLWHQIAAFSGVEGIGSVLALDSKVYAAVDVKLQGTLEALRELQGLLAMVRRACVDHVAGRKILAGELRAATREEKRIWGRLEGIKHFLEGVWETRTEAVHSCLIRDGLKLDLRHRDTAAYVRRYLSDESPKVRLLAVRCLAAMSRHLPQPANAGKTLAQHMRTDPDADIRLAAVRGLCAVPQSAAAHKHGLLEAASDEDPDVAGAAQSALAWLQLAQHMRTDPDADIRLAAVRGLCAVPQSAAAHKHGLLEAASDEDPDVAGAAQSALAWLQLAQHMRTD